MSVEKNSNGDNLKSHTECQACCRDKEIRQVLHDRYFATWSALLKSSITLNGFALIAAVTLWGAYSDKSVGFEMVAAPVIWFSMGLVFALITLIVDFCILCKVYLCSDNLNKPQGESKSNGRLVAILIIVSYLLFLLGFLPIFLKAVCAVLC